MTIRAVHARCINCKAEMKEGHEFCTKCGDRVMPRAKPAIVINEWDDSIGDLAPCQPIGCDAGMHLPGCAYAIEEDAGRPGQVVKGAGKYVGERVVQLTPEQENALNAVTDWYGTTPESIHMVREPFRLFGPAGTGKTTLVKRLARALGTGNIVYGAYTGKAAHVLRRKGVPATTIHSAIYRPVDNAEARARHRVVERELYDYEHDSHHAAEEKVRQLRAELAELEEAIRHGVEFELNPTSEWADADLIVLDEVSMVNEKIGLDVESFGVPVLVLGDPYQLPPVEGGGYWTAHRPDVLLTEVHRQALESPVLALATEIRKGGSWAHLREKVSLDAAMAADQILVWKNATRHTLTAKIRERKGRPAGVPVPGDRVMCLVNNRELGIFNGQQFQVLSVDDQEFLLRDDDGIERSYYYDPDGFRGQAGEAEAKSRRRHAGKVGLFTFAEVITVHKAQGSEWDHVYVVDQTDQMSRSGPLEKRAWAYTAVTRASERVTIAHTGVR